MNIRPVSDLRNKYPEIESELRESGAVYLTKNGYGSAVILGVDEYNKLVGHDNSPVRKTKEVRSDRGFLHKYANPEIRKNEKEAGRIHAMKKFGGVLDE